MRSMRVFRVELNQFNQLIASEHGPDAWHTVPSPHEGSPVLATMFDHPHGNLDVLPSSVTPNPRRHAPFLDSIKEDLQDG